MADKKEKYTRDKYKAFLDDFNIKWQTGNHKLICEEYAKTLGISDSLITRKEIILDMNSNLIAAESLLYKYVNQEDFDICASIRDYMNIQKEFYVQIIAEYFPDPDNDQLPQLMNDIHLLIHDYVTQEFENDKSE